MRAAKMGPFAPNRGGGQFAPNLAIFASHEGSNLQAIVDACGAGELEAKVCLVVSNNSHSRALARAAARGIATRHLSSATHPDPALLDVAILGALREHRADLVLLAGYVKKLGPATLGAYAGRIFNSHPALLPKFGGRGMFGRAVHAAVLAASEPVTGATIHLVDEEYDHGPIVAQCRVSVEPGDDVETLSARVLARERVFWVETLRCVLSGAIVVPRLLVPGSAS
jgi:phosphoribosylglycinamide formyltransferase-1